MKKYFIAIFIVLCIMRTTVQAQRTYFETEVSGEVFKNFELSLSPQIRFSEGFSLKEYFLETDAEYKFNRYFSTAASYRFGTDISKDGDHTNFGQFSVDAKTKLKLKNFEPKFRLRYSNLNEDFGTTSETNYNFMRYKLELEYEISESDFKPYIYGEFFQNLTETGENGLRFEGGLNYKINKHNSAGAYYRLNSQVSTGKCFDVIGLTYKLNL